jgi:MFS family permease
MPSSRPKSVYPELLRDHTLRWLFASAFLGRIPYGMEGLAAVMFFSEQSGSYAIAGLVAGAIGLGIAVGTVIQSRRIDRRGSTALLPLGVLHGLFVALLIVSGMQGWPSAASVALALGTGLALPPTSSAVRGLYPAGLGDRRHLLHSAFALDSALTEFTYVAGPALVSLLVLTADPAAALALSALAALAAIVVLMGATAHHPMPRRQSSSVSGALRAPGLVTLVLASMPLGFAFGVMEVAFPALAADAGSPSAAGMMFVALATASALSSMSFGALASRLGPVSIVAVGSAGYPLVTLLPAAGSSPLAVALLLLPFGLLNGPWISGRNLLTGEVARAGTATEAFAWVLTAMLLGTSLGNVVGGVLVEEAGWRAALVIGSVATLMTVAAAVRRRPTLLATA